MTTEARESWPLATPRPWSIEYEPVNQIDPEEPYPSCIVSGRSMVVPLDGSERPDDIFLIVAAVNHYDACPAERQRAVIAELVAALVALRERFALARDLDTWGPDDPAYEGCVHYIAIADTALARAREVPE